MPISIRVLTAGDAQAITAWRYEHPVVRAFVDSTNGGEYTFVEMVRPRTREA
ncbi:MAG TPA: hypothetical protein VD902_10535 [Symbiobacteriaceae bacterium]|nr:hypothetical protein [Symbiobacteriaceae bacterium]